MRRFAFPLIAAIVAAAIGYVTQTLVDRRPVSRVPRTLSAALPSGWRVTDIVSVNGSPTLFARRAVAGGTTTCAYLGVSEASLKVTRVSRVSCDAEDAAGGRIALVIELIKGPYQMQAHIVRISPTGKAIVGPSVMAIPFVSDTRPVWAVGGGSAWLYDVATPSGPVLLQISPSTGRVERTISFPVRLDRPVMAADNAGLWIGVTPGGASGAIGSPVFFVSSRSGKPVLAWRGGVSDFWVYSDADRAWFAVNSRAAGGPTERIVRFDGSNTQPAENIAVSDANESFFGSFGDVIGDGGSNVWTLRWPASLGQAGGCGPADVERLDLANGVAEVVAHLPTSTTDQYDGCNGLGNGEAVAVGSRLYVLTGESQGLDPEPGYARIFSIDASTAGPTLQSVRTAG